MNRARLVITALVVSISIITACATQPEKIVETVFVVITATPLPTSDVPDTPTPQPTDTPIPKPTNTPEPTNTPLPTSTPTNTPEPIPTLSTEDTGEYIQVPNIKDFVENHENYVGNKVLLDVVVNEVQNTGVVRGHIPDIAGGGWGVVFLYPTDYTPTVLPKLVKDNQYMVYGVVGDYNDKGNMRAGLEIIHIEERSVDTTIKESGIYMVGIQISPGRWKSMGSDDSCYWERRDINQEIIDNHFGYAGGTVTIRETDYEVSFEDCGIWLFMGR